MIYVYDYITWLVTLLKNIPSLSILARYIKNGVLKSTIWNIIDFNGVFKLTDSIDKVLSIPNIKFTNPVVVLSSCIEVSRYCNAFSWLILSINWVEIFKSINNSLNSMSVYCKSLDNLKT